MTSGTAAAGAVARSSVSARGRPRRRAPDRHGRAPDRHGRCRGSTRRNARIVAATRSSSGSSPGSSGSSVASGLLYGQDSKETGRASGGRPSRASNASKNSLSRKEHLKSAETASSCGAAAIASRSNRAVMSPYPAYVSTAKSWYSRYPTEATTVARDSVFRDAAQTRNAARVAAHSGPLPSGLTPERSNDSAAPAATRLTARTQQAGEPALVAPQGGIRDARLGQVHVPPERGGRQLDGPPP